MKLFLIELIYQEKSLEWHLRGNSPLHLSALSLRTESKLSKRRANLALILSISDSAHLYHSLAHWKEYVRKKISHKDWSCLTGLAQ